jgi:hypothetical protein
LESLIEYMEQQRMFAEDYHRSFQKRARSQDAEEENPRHEHHRKQFKTHSRHKRQQWHQFKKSNSYYYDPSCPCPIHLKGKHTWGACYLNPKREQEQPDTTTASENQTPSRHDNNVATTKSNQFKKRDNWHAKHKHDNRQQHQTYFRDPKESDSAPSTSSNSSVESSSPSSTNDAGRTQTGDETSGRNKRDSRGASPTGW